MHVCTYTCLGCTTIVHEAMSKLSNKVMNHITCLVSHYFAEILHNER